MPALEPFCSPLLVCNPPPPGYNPDDLGTFSCRCQIGQGEVNCYPSGYNNCQNFGVPDTRRCSNKPGSDTPDFCNGRMPCDADISCVPPDNGTKGYGEACTNTDECIREWPVGCSGVFCDHLICDPSLHICLASDGEVDLGGRCVLERECLEMELEGDDVRCVDNELNDCDPATDTNCHCGIPAIEDVPTPTPIPGTAFDYCRQVPDNGQRQACLDCLRGATDEKGNQTKIFTAVGCVRVQGKDLAADLIKLLLGIGGGVSLLSLLAAAFKFTISRGDSGKIKESKELITASVSGLLFLIFSIIILQFIGVEILQIPGLG